MMMPARDLLMPGFRDVIGVGSAFVEQESGEYDKLLLSAAGRGLTGNCEAAAGCGGEKDVKRKLFDWTALHAAAQNGHTDIVKLLLDAGADKDVVDKYGDTPLHVAAENGPLTL